MNNRTDELMDFIEVPARKQNGSAHPSLFTVSSRAIQPVENIAMNAVFSTPAVNSAAVDLIPPAPNSPSERPACDVLLVDDNEKLREVLALFLRCSGLLWQEASSGSSALALLDRYKFRLIVTDIFMPDTDGFALIASCRERSPQTPIVAMSGNSDSDSDVMSRMSHLLGSAQVLEKPFRMEDFLKLVKSLLG